MVIAYSISNKFCSCFSFVSSLVATLFSTGACLYDKVTKQYFTNQGTGSYEAFNVGATYTELEYIQSSGTQYIDTGFKPNQDTRVVTKFDMIQTESKYDYRSFLKAKK